jgi:hypothetical protein
MPGPGDEGYPLRRDPESGTIPAMARAGKLLGRRAGPVGAALTLWDLWRRIPPKQRKRILQQARKHGPKLAKQAVKARQKSRKLR